MKSKMRIWRPSLIVLAAAISTPVFAELPAVKLLSAPLVDPATAWGYYGGDLTHTTGPIGWTAANRPPEIKELARALSQDGAVSGDAYATAVSDYVRKNIAIEFRFGLSKGARGAVIDQSGTAFDQAHLMVELLREKGASASYQVGTVTLNAAQFQDWTGLTNAKAACQYLADGGIPATVNSATSCTGLSGNVSTATLAHIWVSTGGKLYDPAYKKHILKTGIDLAAALGCGTAASPTCGTTISGLVPAPTLLAGTSNVYKIQNAPEATINTQLTTYATNLENWIKSYNANNKTVLSLEDLIGGKEIKVDEQFPPASTLPYSSSTQFTWTGDIPNKYRTTLRVQFDSIDQTIYIDELSGKRLKIWGYAVGENTTSYARTVALYAEYYPLAKSTKPNATPLDGTLTLTADHPYAASGGAYMDEVLQRNTSFGIGIYAQPGGSVSGGNFENVMTIVNGWGDSGRSTVSHYGGLVSRDQTNALAEDPSNPNHYWLTHFYTPYLIDDCYAGPGAPSGPVRAGRCLQVHHDTLAANWLAQTSHIARTGSAVAGGMAQLHHSLGTLISGGNRSGTEFSVETSLSANSSIASSGDRQAAFFGLAANFSRDEGSVFEQSFDSWEGGSGVSFLVRSNAKGHAALWVDASNVTTALSKLTNYSTARKSTIQSYVTANSALIVPQNGYLGTYTLSSSSVVVETNATVSYGNLGDRIAYLIGDRQKGSLGLTGGDPTKVALDSTKTQEYSLRKRKYLGVGLNTGDFSLSPAPDLVTGSGQFPFSLAFQRSYSSSGGAEGVAKTVANNEPLEEISDSISSLGGGWRHNYDVVAKWGSDAFKGMGVENPIEAAPMLAAYFTNSKLNSGTPGFRTNMATIITSNWWMSKLQANVISVRSGTSANVFTRLANGTSFQAGPGSSDRLVQTGNRAITDFSSNGGTQYTYNGVSLSVTQPDGSVLSFVHPTGASSFPAPFRELSTAVPQSWTFANGVKVNFLTNDPNNNGCSLTYRFCLKGVSNSLGRSLSITNATQIADENGRQVLFDSDDLKWGNTTTGNNASIHTPTRMTVTGPDNGKTIYDYVPKPTTAIERPYSRINKWYTPSSETTPYIVTSYDSLFRAKSVTDNLSHTADYFVTGIYSSENANRGQSRDPLGNVSTAQFGDVGKETASTDPLGRTSTKVYDNAGRVIRSTAPDGNSVEYQYDVRSNITRECVIAKGWQSDVARAHHPLSASNEQLPRCDAAKGDLITTTVYMEGDSVWTCANAKICNKPSHAIDPKGNRTNYTWNATHGELLTVTSGLNSAGACALVGGVCPVTTYGYTPFTANGATFHLLTSKQETISSGVTTTTTYEYDTANKYVLKSQVVDSGGLALRTCFKFDATGNLISKTEPNANLATCL